MNMQRINILLDGLVDVVLSGKVTINEATVGLPCSLQARFTQKYEDRLEIAKSLNITEVGYLDPQYFSFTTLNNH